MCSSDLSATAPVSAATLARLPRRRAGFWFVSALLLTAAATAVIVWALMRAPEPAPHVPQRLTVSPSRRTPLAHTGTMGKLALSPDGTRLVFVVRVGGKTQLVLRSIDQIEATPMPGTEGAFTPFFSPDGEWVGFQAERGSAVS